MNLSPGELAGLAVAPGTSADLASRPTDWYPASHRRGTADGDLAALTARLSAAQERLYASGGAGLLVVLQGMDASGKDSTVKHVLSGVNPQGCDVTSFKQPSTEELAHDFLWRAVRALPRQGMIGIFNRSYYEDVVVVRVHPELLAPRFRHAGADEGLWRHRFEAINAFERHLSREGTRIVKVFLHLSRHEQARRLLQRLDDPAKLWKFSAADLAEREHWPAYQQAYEDALAATSTRWAPWHVVPADHKSVARVAVATLIVEALEAMDLRLPEVGPAMLEELERARERLSAE